MSERDPSDVPPEVLDELQAERDVEMPSAARDAIWSRLEQSLPGVIPATPTSSSPSSPPTAKAPAASPAANIARAKIALALVVGTGIGLGGGYEMRKATEAPPAASAPIVVSEKTASATASSAILPPVPIADVADLPRMAPSTSPTIQVAPRASGAMSADVSAARSRSEYTLLERARSALARGDATSAIDALTQHRRGFPSGQLAEERDGLFVRALVQAGRRDEARAQAAAFRRRYPQSFFQGIVDEALEESHDKP